ncbi:hypothetical protein MED222_06030 [Vibrio sp. MED222]|nr:hypothetical protein MED222_06030 [Vibrio sp. MED222]
MRSANLKPKLNSQSSIWIQSASIALSTTILSRTTYVPNMQIISLMV